MQTSNGGKWTPPINPLPSRALIGSKSSPNSSPQSSRKNSGENGVSLPPILRTNSQNRNGVHQSLNDGLPLMTSSRNYNRPPVLEISTEPPTPVVVTKGSNGNYVPPKKLTLLLKRHGNGSASSSPTGSNGGNSSFTPSPTGSVGKISITAAAGTPKSIDGLSPSARATYRSIGDDGAWSNRHSDDGSMNGSPYETLQPLYQPEKQFDIALRNLDSGEWSQQNEGLTILRRLALHHPNETIVNDLTTTVAKVLRCTDNLRSQVARAALTCMQDLIICLRRHLDGEAEVIVRSLVRKVCLSNAFLVEGAEKDLIVLVQCVSDQKALSALLEQSAHRSPPVRTVISKCLAEFVKVNGSHLTNLKNLNILLRTVMKLNSDSLAETRLAAKQTICLLSENLGPPVFAQLLRSAIDDNAVKRAEEVVEQGLKNGGFKGAPPTTLSSFKSAKSSRVSIKSVRASVA
mmetsp:Transcript_38064/g.61646  ORF Transcript_38064/g.61646 Transcript_38064/m.61646 type:complete len:460 (+) Transcript_38064:205-1584(+)